MNLETTIRILAGGPGSGCHGDTCGRKPGSSSWTPVMSKEQAKSWNQNSVVKKLLFHGTSQKNLAYVSDKGFKMLPKNDPWQIPGVSVTADRDLASRFESETKPAMVKVAVNISKPYIMTGEESAVGITQGNSKQKLKSLRSEGYDSLIEYGEEGKILELRVFDPDKIVVVR